MRIENKLNKISNSIKRNKFFWLLVAAFASLQLIFLELVWNKPLIWDSTVYWSMGKYMFSAGEIGLWEPFRPPILPIIAGIMWSLGVPVTGFPRLFALLISLSTVIVIYYSLKDVLNKDIALYSTGIVMSSFLFFKYATYFLTGIMAAMLVYSSLYLVYKQKYIPAGFLGAIAFLTRYPAAIVGIAAVLYIWVNRIQGLEQYKNIETLRTRFKQSFMYSIAFFATTIPFFLAAQLYYGNFLHPLIEGVSIPANNPDTYLFGFYYLVELIKSNPLFALMPIGLISVLIKKKWNYAIFFTGLLVFYGFFTFYPHKEPRFGLIFIPFASVFAGKIILDIKQMNLINDKYFNYLFVIIVFAIMVVSFQFNYWQNDWVNQERNQYIEHMSGLEGVVASNDPVPTAYGNYLYMPFRSEELPENYQRVQEQADYIALDSCSWYCTPAIENCQQKIDNITIQIEQDYEKQFEVNHTNCSYQVYEVE